MQIKRITPEETEELLSSGTHVFVDVRTPAEFDSGHVPGAKNVPILESDSYGRMLPNPRFVEVMEANFGKKARIIVGCQMGGRSLRAAEMLLASGFSDVIDMRGGFGGERDMMGRLSFPGWAPRGLPVATDSNPDDRYETLRKNGTT
jgi:rhodanese-related sulfurtransferase